MLIEACRYFYLLIKLFVLIPIFLIKFFLKGLFTVVTIIPRYFVYGIRVIFKKNVDGRVYFNKAIFLLSTFVYLVCVFITSMWITQNIRIEKLSKDITDTTKIIDSIPDEVDKDDNSGSNNDDNNNSNNQEDNNQEDENYKVYDYRKYMNVSYLNVDFNKLLLQNSDTVGWIKINGTNINYPFVQSKDNSYYLNHSFDKKKSYAGWIFGDYRNDMNNLRTNTIIYGHNILNSNLFGTLPRVLKKSWYSKDENLLIYLSTLKESTVWKIFSIYKIKPEAYYLRTVFDDDEHVTFINTIKDRSIHDFGDVINTKDKILTLSTCDNTGNYRIVVHARLVGINK